MHDIQLLLRVSHDERDEQWLTDALQAAIKLEHATLPIYLTALWSIEDERSAVAKTIKDVAIEEMGHFGLACNMLAAITPSDRRIPIDMAGMVPSFPAKGLPGNVLPNVRVYVAGLSKELVNRVFMTIEAPVKPLVARPRVHRDAARAPRSMERWAGVHQRGGGQDDEHEEAGERDHET